MGTMRLFKVWLLIALMVLSGGSLAFAQTNTFPSSGNAGVGTTSPDVLLHVQGVDPNLVVQASSGNPAVNLQNSAGATRGSFGYSVAADVAFVGYAETASHFAINSSGNVGIGRTSPVVKLDVAGTVRARTEAGVEGIILNDVGATTPADWSFIVNNGQFRIGEKGVGPRMAINKTSGNVGIGTTSPTSKLHVAGDATIDGNIAAKYQDVAEWVRAPARLAPGTVVVIDPVENNRVLPASQAYDTRVAGVVSAQPGIILGEAGEGKAKVAHSGRVKVKADARFGSIETGDLLVSSATAGYAMRSTPIEIGGTHIHRPGTIVGKALEPLKEGQGEILVFLTLQ